MKFRRTDKNTVVADVTAFAAYLAKASDVERAHAAKDLNEMLDRWYEVDAFGTEGQLDPRGDHRG